MQLAADGGIRVTPSVVPVLLCASAFARVVTIQLSMTAAVPQPFAAGLPIPTRQMAALRFTRYRRILAIGHGAISNSALIFFRLVERTRRQNNSCKKPHAD